MSPEAVTAERIYRDLHRSIINGELPLGRQIIVHGLAEQFGVSISPVRDALNRLVGTGLVENQAGGGFSTIGFTATDARALYSWQLDIVRSILNLCEDYRALGQPPTELNREWVEAVVLDDATLLFFRRFAECSPNPEHTRALSSTCERLHPLRKNEDVLSVRGVELLALWQTALNDRRGNTLRAMSKYHRRRIRRAEMIVQKAMNPPVNLISSRIENL